MLELFTKGGVVMCINPVDYAFNFPVAEKLITSPAGMLQGLAGVAKALLAIENLYGSRDRLFLDFDHPEVRDELRQYYDSVRRADDCVGARCIR